MTSISIPDIPLSKDDILTLLRHYKGLIAVYQEIYKRIEEREYQEKDFERRRKVREYDIKPIT